MKINNSLSTTAPWHEKLQKAALRLFYNKPRHTSVHHLSDHALADIGLERAQFHGAADHYFDRLAGGR